MVEISCHDSPIVFVLDATAGRQRIIVVNKCDLPIDPEVAGVGLTVSAVTGRGLDGLVKTLIAWVEGRVERDAEVGGLVASLRQIGVLKELEEALSRGVEALARAVPLEAGLVDLRGALACADRILGIDVNDAVLDRVFSTFSLGK